MSQIISNATQGPITDSFIPGVGYFLRADSLLWKKIFLQADERDFLTFSEANSLWMVSEDNTIRWHEDGFIVNNATIASFTGGAAAGNTAVITISAADHTNSGTRSPFNENQIIKVDNTYMFIQSKNTSVPNAHTLTVIQPTGGINVAVALNTVLAAGKTMVPVGNQFAERTGYSEGEANVPVLYSETMGIVKNKASISGTAASIRMKLAGTYSGGYYTPSEQDMKLFIQHKLEISYLALLGSGGTTTDASGNTVNLIKGVEPQVRERGTDYGYNGQITLQDFYNWTQILMLERAGNEHDIKMGQKAANNLESVVTDSMRQGARIYLDNDNGATSKGI
jgi:hypothetical protein